MGSFEALTKDNPFSLKLSEAKNYLRSFFPEEAEMVERKLKYIYFIRPNKNSDKGPNDMVIYYPVVRYEDGKEPSFGEYILTPKYASRISKYDLAEKLVEAAYTIHCLGEGFATEKTLNEIGRRLEKLSKKERSFLRIIYGGRAC